MANIMNYSLIHFNETFVKRKAVAANIFGFDELPPFFCVIHCILILLLILLIWYLFQTLADTNLLLLLILSTFCAIVKV